MHYVSNSLGSKFGILHACDNRKAAPQTKMRMRIFAIAREFAVG